MRIDVDNIEPRNFDRGAVRVIKNFLPKPLFKELQEVVMGDEFPWVFVPYTVKENLYDKKTGDISNAVALELDAITNKELVDTIYNYYLF